MSADLKFFSKGLLREANNAAHREKRSRCIDPKHIEALPLYYIYYVIDAMYHRKNELRLFIRTASTGTVELLDVSVTRYESLPSITFLDDGTWQVNLTKRPYPNFREWQESEMKKPVRGQGKFRQRVLSSYENSCAVCHIDDKSLLRAAHIVDVKDGGTDEIDNGICLCANHETAFDKGLLRILPDYTIQHSGKIGVSVDSVRLPKDCTSHPSKQNLEKKLKTYKN